MSHEGFNRGKTFLAPYYALPHTPIEKPVFSDWVWLPAILTTTLIFMAGAVWLKPTNLTEDNISGLAFLFVIMSGALFLPFSLIFQTRAFVFSDGATTLVLNKKLPSEEEVAGFIEMMNEAKFQYLVKHLRMAMTMDPNMNPKQAINQLLFGRYITEVQADQLSQELEPTATGDSPFGFITKSQAQSA